MYRMQQGFLQSVILVLQPFQHFMLPMLLVLFLLEGAYGLNNLLLFDLLGTSFLSTVCVLIALYAMAGLGFKIRTLPFYEFTKDSVYLDLRNHKHIIMVTVFSAAVHSLSLYVYNYLRAISSNPEMFVRFFVGDILGTLGNNIYIIFYVICIFP